MQTYFATEVIVLQRQTYNSNKRTKTGMAMAKKSARGKLGYVKTAAVHLITDMITSWPDNW